MVPLQYRLQMQLHDYVENSTDILKILNPCRKWNIHNHPWMDVMVLTVGLHLSEETISKTKFSLLNHPSSLSLPESQSIQDFTSLARAIADLHGTLEKGLQISDVDKEIQTMCKYKVDIVTGTVGSAGTDADVYITLTGTQGRSNPMNLDTPFYDDFERGQTDTFEFGTPPLGEVVSVQIEIRSMLYREWFLDSVTVTDVAKDKSEKFPCYQWLTSDNPIVVLRSSKGMLAII